MSVSHTYIPCIILFFDIVLPFRINIYLFFLFPYILHYFLYLIFSLSFFYTFDKSFVSFRAFPSRVFRSLLNTISSPHSTSTIFLIPPFPSKSLPAHLPLHYPSFPLLPSMSIHLSIPHLFLSLFF